MEKSQLLEKQHLLQVNALHIFFSCRQHLLLQGHSTPAARQAPYQKSYIEFAHRGRVGGGGSQRQKSNTESLGLFPILTKPAQTET